MTPILPKGASVAERSGAPPRSAERSSAGVPDCSPVHNFKIVWGNRALKSHQRISDARTRSVNPSGVADRNRHRSFKRSADCSPVPQLQNHGGGPYFETPPADFRRPYNFPLSPVDLFSGAYCQTKFGFFQKPKTKIGFTNI